MWLETIIDLGDCGQRIVNVQYRQSVTGIVIQAVLWNGGDVSMWLTEDAEDALKDIFQANEFEQSVCAAEAECDRKREERLLRSAA